MVQDWECGHTGRNGLLSRSQMLPSIAMGWLVTVTVTGWLVTTLVDHIFARDATLSTLTQTWPTCPQRRTHTQPVSILSSMKYHNAEFKRCSTSVIFCVVCYVTLRCSHEYKFLFEMLAPTRELLCLATVHHVESSSYSEPLVLFGFPQTISLLLDSCSTMLFRLLA